MKGNVRGGSKCTAEFAKKHGKPWLHLSERGSYEAERLLLEFINANNITALNIVGSRGPKEPNVAAFVKRTLERAFFPTPFGWLGGPGEG